eukprot:406876_1
MGTSSSTAKNHYIYDIDDPFESKLDDKLTIDLPKQSVSVKVKAAEDVEIVNSTKIKIKGIGIKTTATMEISRIYCDDNSTYRDPAPPSIKIRIILCGNFTTGGHKSSNYKYMIIRPETKRSKSKERHLEFSKSNHYRNNRNHYSNLSDELIKSIESLPINPGAKEEAILYLDILFTNDLRNFRCHVSKWETLPKITNMKFIGDALKTMIDFKYCEHCEDPHNLELWDKHGSSYQYIWDDHEACNYLWAKLMNLSVQYYIRYKAYVRPLRPYVGAMGKVSEHADRLRFGNREQTKTIEKK